MSSVNGEVTDRPIPLYRRLPIRLAAYLFLALLAFDQISERIYDVVLNSLGFSTATEDLSFLDLHLVPIPGDHENIFLEDAFELEDGTFSPSPEAVLRLEETLEENGLDWLWLSREMRTLAAPDGRLGLIDETWSPEAVLCPDGCGELLIPSLAPVFKDGHLEGWLALTRKMHLEEELSLAALDSLPSESPPPYEYEEVNFEETMATFNRAIFWTGLSIDLCIAGLLSILLSRFVTARLSRLTQRARIQGVEEQEPFPSRGKDEIALLGRSLEQARQRVQGLIGSLEQRDQERREWVAQVSHDLRTPLMALSACIERAGEEQDSERLQATLESARQDVARVCELSEDLLDVARIEAGTELVREVLLPGELMDRAVLGLVPLAQNRGITIAVELAPNCPAIEGDGRLLIRVLENLLRNALRHAHSKVTLSAAPEGRRLNIAVLDDGPGFAATGNRAERDPDSAGLGLTVARRIVEQHGGEFETLDPEGGGAMARCTFPAVLDAIA